MCRLTADPEVDPEAYRRTCQNPQSDTAGLIRRSQVAGRILWDNFISSSLIDDRTSTIVASFWTVKALLATTVVSDQLLFHLCETRFEL